MSNDQPKSENIEALTDEESAGRSPETTNEPQPRAPQEESAQPSQASAPTNDNNLDNTSTEVEEEMELLQLEPLRKQLESSLGRMVKASADLEALSREMSFVGDDGLLDIDFDEANRSRVVKNVLKGKERSSPTEMIIKETFDLARLLVLLWFCVKVLDLLLRMTSSAA